MIFVCTSIKEGEGVEVSENRKLEGKHEGGGLLGKLNLRETLIKSGASL